MQRNAMDEFAKFLELFDWSKTSIAEKSDIVRNLGLLFSAVVGVIFLVWRAVSNDRMARAALKQAQTATGQLEIATQHLEMQIKQADATNKQIQILSENAQLSARAFNATVENNLVGHFHTAMTALAEAESELHRIIALILIGQAAERDIKCLSPALAAIENYARTVSPSLPFDIKQFETLEFESLDIKAKLKALKLLPLAFWLDLKPALRHANVYNILQSLDENTDLSIEQQENLIESLCSFLENSHPVFKNRFWYEQVCKREIQTMINVLGHLKQVYPSWPIVLSRTNLDGCNFTKQNFSHAQLIGSSVRGSECYGTDFSNIIAVSCDFNSAWLTEANLTNADISHCDFFGSALEGPIFVNTDVSGCRFVNCLGFDESQLKDAKNAHEAVVAKVNSDKKQNNLGQ
jgi:hypothetical protein